MAKVKLNPVLEQLRGQVGDLVFKRYGDEIVISRKPDLEGIEPSEAQLAQRERFRQAALYGKLALADPEAKALYTEAAKDGGKPVFALLVADFFNAPAVEEVDLSAYGGQVGDEIVILASDDFGVAGVDVDIADGGGNAVESGAATETPPDSGRWVYAAEAGVATGTTVRIAVTASDRPGGTGQAEAEKTV
jgi:hypothetical protein